MQDQMSSYFKLSSDTKRFRVSCDRDNLTIQIVGVFEKLAQLVSYARDSKSKANLCLIYVSTPADCKSLADGMITSIYNGKIRRDEPPPNSRISWNWLFWNITAHWCRIQGRNSSSGNIKWIGCVNLHVCARNGNRHFQYQHTRSFGRFDNVT